MESHVSTFIIEREDLADLAPSTLVTDGVQIGRFPTCEVVLNHPSVSRLHAGIREERGRFYIHNFSHSSGTTLNGRVIPVEEAEVIADGDVVQIGPFFLYFQREGDGLHIRVALEFALKIGEVEGRGEAQQRPGEEAKAATASEAKAAKGDDVDEVADSLDVYWQARRRERGKMQKMSPLRPRTPSRVVGKARWNWTPTRDLVRPWPFPIFIYGVVVIGVLALLAAFTYTNAYSPAPISSPHTRASLVAQPPIAQRPNANACTTCHTIKTSMEDNCASCHRAEQHVYTVTKPHQDAGINCVNCHTEHRGEDFSPALASLQTCTQCHNDANPQTYNGKRVGTPHRETGFGYPVVNRKWVWEGVEDEELAQKPEQLRATLAELEKMLMRTGGDDPVSARRSAQFHVLHLYRVRAVAGLPANAGGEMSCSSCHRSFGQKIDRDTPRQTCDKCHNGDPEGARAAVFTAAGGEKKPNCISCHVQHVRGKRNWGSSLLAAAEAPQPRADAAGLAVSSHR